MRQNKTKQNLLFWKTKVQIIPRYFYCQNSSHVRSVTGNYNSKRYEGDRGGEVNPAV